MKYLIVIPARYDSSRFPGKPLIDICGKSMILRVWEHCIEAVGNENVIVATDDNRIVEHCTKNNIKVVITSKKCMTGTDRLCEVSKKIYADVYINVQGDEPLLNPSDITDVIDASLSKPGTLINAMCPISDESEFRSITIPKVVCRSDGRLMYMSRAPIPTDKSHSFIQAMKQVCIYAFPRELLKIFGEQKNKTPLEKIEDIEILRFLELGYDVNMVEVSRSSVAVDTPNDVIKVEKILNESSK